MTAWDSKLSGDERRQIADTRRSDGVDPRPWLLDYAGLGWHVFPTLRESKRPLVHWPTEATTSLDQLDEWIEKWPGCGWAVNVGMSQLWVVDCDSEEGSLEWCAHVLAHEEKPGIVCVSRTGGGGMHYFYRDPFAQGVQSVRRFGEHFDTRAAGGYVVVPPTLHASGHRYEWLCPPTKALTRIPEWVVDEWHPRSKRPVAHGLWSCGRGEGLIRKLLDSSRAEATGHARRAAMHAGRLAARGELEDAVIGDIIIAAVTRGVDHTEAERVVRDAFKATRELK